jgi:protein Tex
MNGSEPLDSSAVHPEAYPVVQRIAAHLGKPVASLIGDSAALKTVDAKAFVDDTFGLPTIEDILRELDKPGRDPRPEFKTANFKDGVDHINDLKVGMTLEGVVTNVAAFGAFVDIGVHQDGLVHVSVLADKFVSDPREIVKTGDIVKVKVLEVDAARKRISLTMRLNDEVTAAPAAKPLGSKSANPPAPRAASKAAPVAVGSAMGSAFADAFAKLKK